MKQYIPFFLSFLFITVPDAFSQNIVIDQNLTVQKIGLMVHYLEDKAKKSSITNIGGSENEMKWQAFAKESQGFGYTRSVYWVRLTVQNTSSQDMEFYLQEDYPLIDDVILYIPEKGGHYTSMATGDNKPFFERPIKHRTFVFPLTLAAKSTETYYLRLQTEGSMNFVLKIFDPSYFREQAFNEYLLLLFFTGIIFIMIFYNLMIFMFSRDFLYLCYALFIADTLVLTMILNGTLFQFLLPGSPRLVNFLLPVSLSFCVLVSLWFAKDFLEMKQSDPFSHKLTKGYINISAIILICTIFMPYRFSMPLATISTIPAILYGLTIGFKLVLKKIRPAYFYLTAWLVFLIGAFSYLAKSIGVLPTTFFTDWSLWIGTALQVTLFSLGLADRINQMRRELKLLNLNLEEKVAERTEELNSAVDNLQKMNRQLGETKDQLWSEMQVAKKIQTVLLPKKPEVRGYEICAFMEPADEVGGDYYDVINLMGRDFLVIGDVSGHGVPAGLVMMMAQTAINVTVNHHPDIPPSELLVIINKTISSNIKQLGEDRYMSITVLATHENGEFQFSGLHQDIMIYRAASDKVDLVETSGIWIGIAEDIHGMLKDHFIKMDTGDTMLLFTDGIIEAQLKENRSNPLSPAMQMFGETKLAAILQKLGPKTVEEIKAGILAEMTSRYYWNDDVTMVLIKRVG